MEFDKSGRDLHSNNLSDAERVQMLARSVLLDSISEEAYDRFTELAALILEAPVSLISLIDRDRQYFKSYYGLPEPWASRRQTPLSHSFCQYVVHSREPLIVKDARKEEFLRDNLAITDLGVVAYLGFPLIVKDQALGSFCVIDGKPRVWSEREIGIVRALASFVTTEIALRIEVKERQKVTEQLWESEARFRALANHAPIMIWQSDENGASTFVNTTWCTFTGLTEEESLGDAWSNTIHPHDRAQAFASLRQVLGAHQPYYAEFRVRRADGIYRDVIAHGSVYKGADDAFLGYIGTLLDVTEQKELERQREAFLSMATHELKTPLTLMQGNIQLAQRRLKNLLRSMDGWSVDQQTILAQASSLLTRGLESLQMQTRLINDLLDLSRIQAGKLDFHLTSCDLVLLVQQTVQDLQAANPRRVITVDPPSYSEAILVLIDQQRIRQVVSNYVTNALKYSLLDQPVQVRITSNGDVGRVAVRDYGIGLSPEQQKHIWERFYQGHDSIPSTKGTPSLGLGLHICQVLIRSQHGEVGVESTKGEGSTFWFTLPLLSSILHER